MDLHSLIWFAMLWFGMIAQLVLLVPQLRTQRSHPHRSLRLLILGSVLGLVYMALTVPLYMLGLAAHQQLLLQLTCEVLFVLSTIIGVSGSILLLREYRRLATLAAGGKAPPAAGD